MGPTIIQTQPYTVPPGKVDFPFSYVYDATGLTDTDNYVDLQVPMQGDSDFILRSIMGVPLVCSKFAYKNPSRQFAIGALSTGVVFPNNWSVLPEKLYSKNQAIYFNLFNVSRNNTSCSSTPIYNSFIAFNGVKRFDANTIDLYDTAYNYRVLPQTYVYSLTINQARFASAGNITSPLRQYQPMDRYDFQLLQILIAQSGSTSPLLTNDFQIWLYDSKQHQLSSLPLNQSFVNAARQTAAQAAPYQAVWPTPPIVYPAGSTIIFDIVSMLCSTSLPQSYQVCFQGLWRIPV